MQPFLFSNHQSSSHAAAAVSQLLRVDAVRALSWWHSVRAHPGQEHQQQQLVWQIPGSVGRMRIFSHTISVNKLSPEV